MDAEKAGGIEVSGAVVVVDDDQIRPDVQRIDPIQVFAKAVATKRMCELSGTAETNVLYRCSRCLVDVQEHISADLHEMFSHSPLTKEQEEADVAFVQGDEIELDAFVEQAVLLAMSPKPLCKNDCAGLCVLCGVNRNEQTCACKESEVDPRLEVLANLLDKQLDTSV